MKEIVAKPHPGKKKSKPFRCKQFDVYQDRCGMKVGTDGMLLGAWAGVHQVQRILDVGTGTGLLSLMMAQRNVLANIDAVELDEHASQQAKENFLRSPWKERLHIHEGCYEQFQTLHTYDLIVSNPPYFENSLKPELDQRKKARHTDSLSLESFLAKSLDLLKPEGRIQVILPVEQGERLIRLGKELGLCLIKRCKVCPGPDKPVFRYLLSLQKIPGTIEEEKLFIYQKGNQYSEKYIELTKGFYTIF
ncbi:methyltransferase [Rapidithrix thailandica]|uniref:tRNA1(Val) (adenine(37)-N6)-methyltransferase n=1 Tax=Rapidithrix thailandica TaxID=413964 RepID=A0AAW9S0K1_9BACT